MILFIETSEPKNCWAAPGDDVSPEEVIRLFEADPGLVKNTRKIAPSIYSHWPKHFATLNGTIGRFDEFPDADALRKLSSLRRPQHHGHAAAYSVRRFLLPAAKALAAHSFLATPEIISKSLEIASEIDIYTNSNIILEELSEA